jgi:DNA polymerase III alpha subunit
MQLFGAAETTEDWDDTQRNQAQLALLGVSLGMSPLEQIADDIQSSGAISTLEAENHVGEKVTLAGMRQTWRRMRSRSTNQMMCMINLEDLEGSLQVLVPPALYRSAYTVLHEIGPFLITGQIENDPERHQLRLVAEKIQLVRP